MAAYPYGRTMLKYVPLKIFKFYEGFCLNVRGIAMLHSAYDFMSTVIVNRKEPREFL